MIYRRGTVLSLFLAITKSGALYDPSPLPTVQFAYKPDGTPVTASLNHPATGIFSGDIFSAADTEDVEGTYQAQIGSSDTTTDLKFPWLFKWSVDDTLANIEDKTALINAGVVFAQVAVGTDGLTTITEGMAYMLNNNPANALNYVIEGYPLPTLHDPAYWHGTNKSGGAMKITGEVSDVDSGAGTFTLTFEMTAAQSARLKSGVYALHLNSDASNLITVPNDTLIVNPAI